jgi:hypothetical protein
MMKRLRELLTLVVFSVLFLSLPAPTAQAIVPPPAQWITPLSLDFGPVGVGSQGQQLVVTLTNSGDVPITSFLGGLVTAPFSDYQDCTVIVGGLQPGQSCHYYYNFAPTSAGTFNATSSPWTEIGPFNISLQGVGVGPGITINAHDLDFGTVYTNGSPGTTNPQILTIKNTGMAPLTNWSGGLVNPPFSDDYNCDLPGGVPPGGTCSYMFGFSPTSVGPAATSTTLSSNGGSVTVNLSGTGSSSTTIQGQRATPRSLDFGPVGVGVTSPQLAVTITNLSAAFSITGWSIGAVSAPFSTSNDCSGGLAPLASCHINYTFHPTAAGTFTATPPITNSDGSFSVSLQGVGVAPSLTADATWLDFGPVLPGVTSPQQVVTLTNTGLSPIGGWPTVLLSAPPFTVKQDCSIIAGGLLPGQSCHYYYTYTPTFVGTYSTTSHINSDAGSIGITLMGETYIPIPVYLPLVIR